jgi:hypothetical protein
VKPRAHRALRLAPLAAACAAAACVPATFVPAAPRRAEVAGASARIEGARLSATRGLRVRTRFEGTDGARLQDARLVAAREPLCGQGGALAHAGEFSLQGGARWQRPLEVSAADQVELAFSSYEEAFDERSLLELELATPGGTSCLRLPLAGPGESLAWQAPSPVATVGLRVQFDTHTAAGLTRIGLLTHRYRHTLELGVAAGRAPESLLADRASLAFGVGSERLLWNVGPASILSTWLEIGYQARLAFSALPDGPRVIHGPRIGLRPLTLNFPSARLLEIGPRFGTLSVMDLFVAFWMASDGRHSVTMTGAFSWDVPVSR